MGEKQEDRLVWHKPARIPRLHKDEVVIWKFNPDDLVDFTDDLSAFLSHGEKKRLACFKDEDARRLFIHCRGVLHFLLAAITAADPGQIAIRNGQQGKPELDGDQHQHTLPFNISHTQGLCLIALSRCCDVGVDVEKVQPLEDLERLAQAYMTAREFKDWQAVEADKRPAAFYTSWCAKEALLKAVGCGLTIHPGQLSLQEALSGRPLRGTQEDGCLFEFDAYALQALPLEDGYQGWLAVLGHYQALKLVEFSTQLFASSGLGFLIGRKVEK